MTRLGEFRRGGEMLKRSIVAGAFESLSCLEASLETLRGQGVRSADVSVLIPTVFQSVEGIPGRALGWLNEASKLEYAGTEAQYLAGGPFLERLRNKESTRKFDLSTTLMELGFSRLEADFFLRCVEAGKPLLLVQGESTGSLEKVQKTLASHEAQGISLGALEEESASQESLPLFTKDLKEGA